MTQQIKESMQGEHIIQNYQWNGSQRTLIHTGNLKRRDMIFPLTRVKETSHFIDASLAIIVFYYEQ